MTLEELYQQAAETIREEYRGIFPPEHFEPHIRNYVHPEWGAHLAQLVQSTSDLAPGARILDIGCGYGSFVLGANQLGLDACGIDLSEKEIRFARERYKLVMQAEPPYQVGNALDLPFPDNSFSVVTLWNVAEHVPNTPRLLHEAVRVLCPGGDLYLEAPNYLALRREAHYQVPWLPLLPKPAGAAYLRALGRHPAFLQQSIFYVTNWQIIRILRCLGCRLLVYPALKLQNPDRIQSPRLQKLARAIQRLHLSTPLRWLLTAAAYNPFRSSLFWIARKA